MRIHILYHAKQEPFFGLWMIEELESYGYSVSAGTLYPILHNLEKEGILEVEKKVVEGKVRKYYSITEKGEKLYTKIQDKTKELFSEVLE